MTLPNFVTAIIRNQQNQILMIQVHPDDSPHPYWTLPGGRVEKGETAEDALIREVLEETGITIVEIGQVAYRVIVQFDDRDTLAIVYHTTQYEGIPNPNDPEDEVLQAAWLPLDEAIIHLKRIDYLPMSEPPVAFLNGDAALGKVWRYRINGQGAIWVNND